MIPSIAEILNLYKIGQCTMEQALQWIDDHANIGELRDAFAMHALAGMCGGAPGPHLVPHTAAQMAYDYADEMIRVRAS